MPEAGFARLSAGEKVVLGSATALLVASPFNVWTELVLPTGAVERFSAWSGGGFAVKTALLSGFFALALVFLHLAGITLDIPGTLGRTYAVLGLVTLALLASAVVTGPPGSAIDEPIGLVVRWGWMIYGALVLAGGIAYGGRLHAGRARAAPPEAPGQREPMTPG